MTFTNNGAVNLEPHISVTLCQKGEPSQELSAGQDVDHAQQSEDKP